MEELQKIVTEIEARSEEATFEQEGIPIVEASVTYPAVTYKGFQKNAAVLSRFYSCGAARYLKFVKKQMLPAARECYVQSVRMGTAPRLFEARQTFQATYNAGLVSIYYDQYEYTGGAHGGTARFSDTYYLPEGRFLRLRDLFRPRVPYRKLLLSEITRQIEQSLGRGGAFYYDNYRRGVKKHFSPAQFYLRPKGLSLYYQQYTIAPYSMGLPTFFIPYERLENLLRFDLTLPEE